MWIPPPSSSRRRRRPGVPPAVATTVATRLTRLPALSSLALATTVLSWHTTRPSSSSPTRDTPASFSPARADTSLRVPHLLDTTRRVLSRRATSLLAAPSFVPVPRRTRDAPPHYLPFLPGPERIIPFLSVPRRVADFTAVPNLEEAALPLRTLSALHAPHAHLDVPRHPRCSPPPTHIHPARPRPPISSSPRLASTVSIARSPLYQHSRLSATLYLALWFRSAFVSLLSCSCFRVCHRFPVSAMLLLRFRSSALTVAPVLASFLQSPSRASACIAECPRGPRPQGFAKLPESLANTNPAHSAATLSAIPATPTHRRNSPPPQPSTLATHPRRILPSAVYCRLPRFDAHPPQPPTLAHRARSRRYCLPQLDRRSPKPPSPVASHGLPPRIIRNLAFRIPSPRYSDP
ncbi:hypothetical protein DFH06DRAFT_725495 [Mycena polygramma]|nr:hypothetical protein DFH06DRAFT_725495 [Mycena polygramma]